MKPDINAVDRRTALKLLGGTAAATSFAGCFQGNDDTRTAKRQRTGEPTKTPTDTSTPEVTATPTDTPTKTPFKAPAPPEYLKWVPGSTLMGYSAPFRPVRIDESKLERFRDQMNSEATSSTFQLSDFPLAVTPILRKDTSEIIASRGVHVVKGEFTQREVIIELPERFVIKSPEYENFLITVDSGRSEVVAVIDGVAIAIDDIPESQSPREVATNVIDTRFGEFHRLSRDRPHLESLGGWIGVHDLTQLVSHEPYTDQEPEGKIGHGGGWTLTENGIDTRVAIQFESAEQATDEAVDRALESDIPIASTWTNKKRTHYGKIVLVEGKESFDTFLKSEK